MKVSFEQAQKEVENWLDHKRVSPKKREGVYAESIEVIVDAISFGDATIEEDGKIIQSLKFPITDSSGNMVVSVLEYTPRITYSAIKSQLQTVKPGDGNGRLIAVASGLTGKPIGILEKMDTEDISLLQAISVFFL